MSELRRLEEDLDAYRVQAQGAAWADERMERLAARAARQGHKRWAHALTEEAKRQRTLEVAARAGMSQMEEELTALRQRGA